MDNAIRRSLDERLQKFNDLLEAGFDSTYLPEKLYNIREAENAAKGLIGFADGLMVCGVIRLAEYNAVVKPCYAFLRRLTDVFVSNYTEAVIIRKLL